MSVSVVGVQDEYFREDRSRWTCKITAVPPARLTPGKLLYAPGMLKHTFAADAALALCHGLWMYHNWVVLRWAHRTGRPYLVSPHGMLDLVDLRKSRLVKWIARKLYVDRLFRGAASVRAISESEAQSIRDFGVRAPICLVPNGVWMPDSSTSGPAPWQNDIQVGKKVLLYLGRLHPKKGLPNLLKAWARLRKNKPLLAMGWHLVVAGWDQDGHDQELKRLAGALGIAQDTYFAGPLFHEAKHAAYCTASAFVTPSTSEGMPTVVLEAWAYGLPVLMTPQCNLPQGFTEHAAIRMDPSPDSIEAGLCRLLAMSEDERGEMGQRGRCLVKTKFSWPRIAREICDVYAWILGMSPKPGCVRIE